MNRCFDCGAPQPEGTMFCSECGRSLLDISVQATNVLPFTKSMLPPSPPPLSDYKLTSASNPKQISFVIPGRRHRLTLELVDQIRIGRSDYGTDMLPDLDLTDYEGMEMGVSRMHAALQLTDKGIIISDLGSTNGTLLNNSRLPPEQPFLLQTGDEIRFGDLLVHIFFDL